MELSKHLPKLTLALLCAVLPLRAADITPGYTFSSGETVTHTKLNTAAAGGINTTFYTGASTITDPATGGYVLIYDATSGEFRKWALSALLIWDEWITGRTAEPQPAGEDTLLVYDASAAAYRQMSLNALVWTNAAWFSAVSNAHPATAEALQLLGASNGVYYTLAASNLSAGLDFTPLTRLVTLASNDLFLVQRGTTNYFLAGSNVVESVVTTTTNTPALVSSLASALLTNSLVGTNLLKTNVLNRLPRYFTWLTNAATGIQQAEGIASVANPASGKFFVTFSEAYSTTNYSVVCTARGSNGADPNVFSVFSNTTTTVWIQVHDEDAGGVEQPGVGFSAMFIGY